MDNHHVTMTSSPISCGVAALYNITSDLRKVLYAIATNLYHPSRGQPYAVISWSDLADDSNGHRLARLIHNGFINTPQETPKFALGFIGACFQTPPVDNPKTGNEIRVWWWVVDHTAFKKWYIEERVKRAQVL